MIFTLILFLAAIIFSFINLFDKLTYIEKRANRKEKEEKEKNNKH